ncbi:hypothetical protein FE257_001905 [Aspergillus nanangensis]|uniref:Nudix hydrolase domain-containing protein n=1 Tax=Aspergillus nanangensis TaxID=2582783 RepID=A0AAD4CEN2_ASPNN|nr:hypothetical protein FE257_001905 [Aspergillus nanangensis]
MPSAKSGGANPKPKSPAIPSPSSSVILVSPKNEILLLHRVKTSTSFASAHVFPGGNLDPQDGPCPPPQDIKRHEDASWYRNAALRELFEESGILLAKDKTSGKMLAVSEAEREQGRRAIHQNKITFTEWLQQLSPGAVPDTDQLLPFSRWVTPTNVPKRFTTQMYLYFLPLPVESEKSLLNEIPTEGQREEIQIPTSDGGVEISEARFLPASEWLRMSDRSEIILFPPQFMLLHLASQFLDQEPRATASLEELARRRSALVDFAHSGSPPWTEKCISPKVMKMTSEGQSILGLDHPGPELNGSTRRGESDLVVMVEFKKGSVRKVSVRQRKDVLEEERKKSHL